MMHGVWKRWLVAYAEGSLWWPFSKLVEAHTKQCQECRFELRSELALLGQIDTFLFQPAEVVRTVASVSRRQLLSPMRGKRSVRGYSLVFAGAALLLVLLAMIPAGIGVLFSPSVTVVAASSWSEGVATSFSAVEDVGSAGSPLTSSAGVSQGKGVAVPMVLSEERGG